MKTFKHFLLFAFALVLSVGCTDPEPEAEPATLEVNPTSLTFATEGGSQEITVTSNTYWSVTSTESWLTISATSGNGDQVITVTASANEGEDIRSAVLKFSAEEVSPIEVTAQQSSQTVELPNLVTTLEASYSLEYKAETVEFEITSNVAWILSSDAEWLTVSPEEGVNDGTASFSVALNDSTELRTATLTISGADLEPIEVTIEQGAANLSSTLTSNYEFGNEGGEQSFEIISNVAWTITSDSEWLTVSPLEGENSITASFTVASYDGSEDRVGTFTIASELTEDITIEVTQTAAPFDDSKAITFADECLEMALFDAGVDTDEDGWISYAEAAAVATLTTLNGQMISSFDEIVYFTSLTVLRIDDNDLTSINLSMCPSLQTLNIASNKLSELNLSNNPLIGAVWCNDNSLTELNLENAAELTQLWCGNNKISSLDFSHSPSMLYLDCSNNSISELEIPEMLSTLDASKNSLSKVDISERYLLSKVSLTGQSTGNCELTVNAVQSFIYSSFAADDVTLNVLQGPIAVEVAESLSTSFSLNTTMGDYSGNYAVGLMASADLVNLTTYSPSVLAASLYTTMGAMGVDFTKVDSEFVFNSNLSGVATPEAWGLTESTEYVICAMPLTSAGDVDDSELPTIIFSSTGIQDDPAGEYNPAYNSTAVVTTSMTSASVELTIPDGVSKVYYYNATGVTADEAKAKLQEKVESGSAWDTWTKSDTYTISGLTYNTSYVLATISEAADGSYSELQSYEYTTNDIEFTSSASLSYTTTYGAHSRSSDADAYSITLDVKFENGAVGYYFTELDSYYQKDYDGDGVISAQDCAISMVNAGMTGSYYYHSSEGECTGETRYVDSYFVIIPVDANGAFGTPIALSKSTDESTTEPELIDFTVSMDVTEGSSSSMSVAFTPSDETTSYFACAYSSTYFGDKTDSEILEAIQALGAAYTDNIISGTQTLQFTTNGQAQVIYAFGVNANNAAVTELFKLEYEYVEEPGTTDPEAGFTVGIALTADEGSYKTITFTPSNSDVYTYTYAFPTYYYAGMTDDEIIADILASSSYTMFLYKGTISRDIKYNEDFTAYAFSVVGSIPPFVADSGLFKADFSWSDTE